MESHILAAATDGTSRAFIANPYYFKVDSAGNQLPYIDRHNERFLEQQIWTLELISGNIDQKSQNVSLADFPLMKENGLPILTRVSARRCRLRSTAQS